MASPNTYVEKILDSYRLDTAPVDLLVKWFDVSATKFNEIPDHLQPVKPYNTPQSVLISAGHPRISKLHSAFHVENFQLHFHGSYVCQKLELRA